MTSVLEQPTGTTPEARPADKAQSRPRRSRRRSASGARWMAVLVLGFVVGAALVLLTDSDASQTTVAAPPAVSGATGDTTAATGGSGGGVTDVNGQHVHGVKAQDVAAEA